MTELVVPGEQSPAEPASTEIAERANGIQVQNESPLRNVQLHYVNSLDDVHALYEWAGRERSTPIGLDVETTGLHPQKDKLRLVQLGDMNHGWAVPVMWAGAVIELIQRMLEKRQEFVGHNAQFDRRFLAHDPVVKFELPWYSLHDTMFIAALADPVKPKGLKPLSIRLIDKNASAGQHLLDDGMRQHGWTWATVPVDFPPYHLYAALDTVLTCHIWNKLAPGVLRSASAAYDLERGVVPLLAGMMDRGLLLDRAYANKTLIELREYAAGAREWLKSTHNVESLMSAKQLHVALTALGVEVNGRTPTGMPSVTKEVLREIAAHPDVPQSARDLASTTLKVRHAEKIIGSYIENFITLADENGYVHPGINQVAARSGRMSISDPALQTLPRDDKVVRGCFIPHPGNVFISCDYGAIEMRLAASLSHDPGLIQAFYEADHGGSDLYVVIASNLFGEPVEKSDKRRQLTKNMSYAKLYGSGVRKMAATVGMPYDHVKVVNDEFSAKFSGLDQMAAEFQQRANEQIRAGEDPAVYTSTGRRLPVDRDRLYSATNARIQGEAAEVLKQGICRLAAAGFSDNMLLPIHDEVLLEVPESDAEAACRAIEEAMGDTDQYAVPLTAEAKILRERWVKA